MSGDPQAAREWRAAYERVVRLATEAGDDGMSVSVPPTPDWTGRDLLSHMVGVGVDAIAGEVPDDLHANWTKGHVDARARADVHELLDEWATAAPRIEAFIAESAPDPLGDVIIHEQDLRTALQQPGARDTDGLLAIRDVMTEKFGSAVEAQTPPGALVLRANDGAWTWASATTEPVAVVDASTFDLFRAMTSRRTADQLRGWTTSGSIEPFLAAFAHLGPLPDQPLPE